MSKTAEEQLAEALAESQTLKRIVDTQKKKLEAMVAEVEEKTTRMLHSEEVAATKTKLAEDKIAKSSDVEAELAAVTLDRNRLEYALDSLTQRLHSHHSNEEADVADSKSKMLGLQYELTSRRLQGNDEILRQHLTVLEGENAKLRERVLSLESLSTVQISGSRSAGGGPSQEWHSVVKGLRDENTILQRENLELRRQNEDMQTKQFQLSTAMAISSSNPSSVRSTPPTPLPCPKCSVPKVPRSVRHCTTQTAAQSDSQDKDVNEEAMLISEIATIHEQHSKVVDQYEDILAAEVRAKDELMARIESLQGELKIKALRIGKLIHQLETSNANRIPIMDGELMAAQKAASKAELEVRSLTRRVSQMELARDLSLSMSRHMEGSFSPAANAFDDDFLPVHQHVTQSEAKLRAQRDSTRQHVSDLHKEIRYCEAAVEYWSAELRHDPSVATILMNARQRLRVAKEDSEKTRCELRTVDSMSESTRLAHVSQERGALMRRQ